MPASSKITLIRPDGLHILAQATLSQLVADTTLNNFADGLLTTALNHTILPDSTRTLAEALYFPGPQTYPLLTALLALDAELNTVNDDEQRVFPLPGFLTYRSRLPFNEFPPNTVRLPPLNPDGRYVLSVADGGCCYAVRLDLHPELKVAGHIRLAVSSSRRPPTRLYAAEHRLDRQVLAAELIEKAILTGSEGLMEPLTQVEQRRLIEALRDFT